MQSFPFQKHHFIFSLACGSFFVSPACAGKSDCSRTIGRPAEDHPRMCGEKTIHRCVSFRSVGSPPHVRGKGFIKWRWKTSLGITPACAGKRLLGRAACGDAPDHPRMCGEKLPFAAANPRPRGSPPHVRGKVFDIFRPEARIGITPACAGKRLKRSRSTVPHAAIVPLFPSVCNKPAGSDGSPAGHDAPPFLTLENAAPASPAYNLRSL